MTTPIYPHTPWIQYWKARPRSRLRLFCFPYAGGGASIFRNYTNYLPEEIEVLPVQLPGRENRLAERPFSNLDELVSALEMALHPYLDVPYAFFGHSMGALISFELAIALYHRGDVPGPQHLFVSGHRAPHLSEQTPPTHLLPDAAFIESLRNLGGTSEEVLKYPELLQMMLPLLRADFTLCETYTYIPNAPLDCPLSAFGGLQDKEVLRETIQAWSRHTCSHFKARFFAGDHFFLLKEQSRLLWAIAQELLQ